MKDKNPHTVSLFDAKTHLSKLLKEVQSGNILTITKRGIPVAQLVPYSEKKEEKNINIRQYINEGRR